MNCTLLLMMAVNRISQTNLALMQTRSVLKLLNGVKMALASGAPRESSQLNVLYKELLSSSGNLAATLSTKREFASALGGGKFQVDPRFLLFEFCHNLLLRPPQVKLVKKLMSDIQAGRSVCTQV